VANKLLALALVCTLTGVTALLGCSGDDPPCDSCIGAGGGDPSSSSSASAASAASGAGGSTCNGTRGTLTGDVYLNAAPGQPSSMPAGGALIALRRAPDDIPLYGKADDQGHYNLEIPPGDWLVTGEESSGCTTNEPMAVTVDPCGVHELDLVIDLCFG